MRQQNALHARSLAMNALHLTTACLGVWCGISLAADPTLKTEHFDSDPHWEALNNRTELKTVPMVKQDFGYSTTSHASKSPGEVGGSVTRAMKPAYYAANIGKNTLDDKLSASGTFAITACQPGAGLFFGFFNSNQPGGSGRPIGSLGLDFDFESSGGRLAVRLITGSNQSCGTFITPYLPGKYRTTPLKHDGTRYSWTLDYSPTGANGNGQFVFTLRSDNHPLPVIDPKLPAPSQQEERARFPTTTKFTVDLPAGYKQQGTTFDRFGLMNMMKAGGTAMIHFGEVKLNGESVDFSKDPGWVASGNRESYENRELVGAHNFGFSSTNHAGGSVGELGGDFWRSGKYAYIGDRIGPFDLTRRLEARGKVKLVTAGPDSDMLLGWFSSANKEKSPDEAGNFIGVHVGGPTRVGHYFAPYLTTAKGEVAKVEKAPVLTPGRIFDWSLLYDPEGNSGLGEMKVTLGDESVTLPLKPGRKEEGATLDRFGMFTSQMGGQMVRIYLDDLTYTAGKP